jgi:hypothetical protein
MVGHQYDTRGTEVLVLVLPEEIAECTPIVGDCQGRLSVVDAAGAWCVRKLLFAVPAPIATRSNAINQLRAHLLQPA